MKKPVPPRAMVYVYEVTASTVPSTKVGDLLVARLRELHHTWEFLNTKTGERTYIVGRRTSRVCNTCYNAGKVEDFGHDGEHAERAA